MRDYSVSHVETTGGVFPNTAAKNSSTPLTPDGTEFIKETLDDHWGARQAIMDEAHLTPDGATEIVGASQQLDALIALFRQEKRIGIENNAVDAVNDLDFLAGVELGAITPFRQIRLAATLVKQIDANWAQGTNLGGFPSALVLTIGTWYHSFIINKADGTTDAGFDTSLTAANLLADAVGYVNYRRVASIYYVDGVTGIRPFIQRGNVFRWNENIQEISAAALPTTKAAGNFTAAIPAIAAIKWLGEYAIKTNNTGGGPEYYGVFRSNLFTDITPAVTNHDVYVFNSVDSFLVFNAPVEVLTDDGDVYARFNIGTNILVYRVLTLGYEDERAL